jgi:hypothetical protein
MIPRKLTGTARIIKREIHAVNHFTMKTTILDQNEAFGRFPAWSGLVETGTAP